MAYRDRKRGGRQEEIVRVRIPKGKEMLGIVEEMLGGGRFRIRCKDGNSRICRVSGKFKRRKWIRPGDIVLVVPWEVQSDERGDVSWKYRRAEIEWMRRKGMIDGLI